MLALLLLVQAADPIHTARTKLSAEQRCAVDPDSTDVTVCGMRRADRFRVPFVTHDPGDPRHEPVMAERTRLLARTTPIQEKSLFLVGGGMAGVSMTLGPGGVRTEGLRTPAP